MIVVFVVRVVQMELEPFIVTEIKEDEVSIGNIRYVTYIARQNVNGYFVKCIQNPYYETKIFSDKANKYSIGDTVPDTQKMSL